jgi:hypothetical protein
MVAANTKDAVRELIGKRIVGVLFDALPAQRADLRKGNKTLVFDDGTGFTFNSKGAFWTEIAEDVSRAVAIVERELRSAETDLRGVLELAGALTGVSAKGTGE